ncbi:MAG: hypothetical protein M4D80_20365 [Myxococcota bacterium]|nr:hypothetical protein [Myxococcota bacterium]
MDAEQQAYSTDVVHKSSDGGLSGLGLIMQLVGNIMTAVVACYGMISVIVMLEGGGRGAPAKMMLFIFAVLGTSLARSVIHATAGRSLLYELSSKGTPMSHVNRYVLVAAVQTVVVAFGMLIIDVPPGQIAAIVLVLAAWPIALALVAKPKIMEHGNVVPMADDKGFAGASILLLIFGCIGVGIGAVMLLAWLEMPSEGAMLMKLGTLVAFGMLTIRSILHVRAGMRGSSAVLMAETAEAAGKYASFGVIASVVSGGVFFVAMFGMMGGRGGPGGGMVMMLMLFMVVMITWVLLVWPLTVKRFFGDRQFATMIDEKAPSQQSSSDRGLPTLGWLLLAFGAYAFAGGIGGLFSGGVAGGRGSNPMGEMMGMGMLGNVGDKSVWFGIATAALQIWAGVELISLSPRFKTAGMVFGGVASAIALYIYLPLMGDLMSGGMAMISNPMMVGVMFVQVMMALVIPVATFIFVQRKIRDPKALAQTFE